jgi:hypothetical protein
MCGRFDQRENVYYCFGHYFLTKKLNKNRLSISKYGLIVAVDHFLIFFCLKKKYNEKFFKGRKNKKSKTLPQFSIMF